LSLKIADSKFESEVTAIIQLLLQNLENSGDLQCESVALHHSQPSGLKGFIVLMFAGGIA